MYKFCPIKRISFLFLLCFLTACTHQETGEEQSFPSGVEGSNVSVENVDNRTENAESRLDVQQDISIDIANRDILAACAGTTITQTIESSGGRNISVDAEVIVDGVSRVSRYRYVPQPFTEELRKLLLKKMHPAETWDVNAATVYDAEKDAWEFVTPRGENWVYQVSDSGLLGEQILNHERVDTGLDYAEETQVSPVPVQGSMDDALLMELIEVTGSIPREIDQIGQAIIGSVAETRIYSCSYIHICGKDGAHSYAKAVYKQMIDGMPVTAWHNFSTVTVAGSVFPVKVWGSFFTADEIGLDRPILSAEEAVAAMQEQIDSVPIQGNQISITKISLEYLAVISPDGELEIVPIWRFWPGSDEMERSMMSERILAVNAVSGELIWEERGVFTE